jgi:hypothetical protein
MTDATENDCALPKGFAHFKDLVGHWAKPTEHERRELRATSSIDALKAYYERVGPEIAVITRHLDGFPFGPTLPSPELRLLQIAQMYMEVAWAVEVLGAPEESDQVPRDRWRITTLRSQTVLAAASPDAPRRDSNVP